MGRSLWIYNNQVVVPVASAVMLIVASRLQQVATAAPGMQLFIQNMFFVHDHLQGAGTYQHFSSLHSLAEQWVILMS